MSTLETIDEWSFGTGPDWSYMTDDIQEKSECNKKRRAQVSAKVTVHVAANEGYVAFIYELASALEFNGTITVFRNTSGLGGRIKKLLGRRNLALPAIGVNWVLKIKVSHASARRITLFVAVLEHPGMITLEFKSNAKKKNFTNLALIDSIRTGGYNFNHSYPGVAIIVPPALAWVIVVRYTCLALFADMMKSLKFSDNTITILPPVPLGVDILAFLRPTANTDYRHIN
jgi:hypothetical protein